jgi:CBS-domain-containing membrane protein
MQESTPGGAPDPAPSAIRGRLRRLFKRLGGTGHTGPPRVMNSEVFWSWFGAFLGISAIAWGERLLQLARTDSLLLIGSMGASAVLVYGAPRSPLAQPRNLVGGHLLSALVGVTCYQWLADFPELAAALAVATAIALMQVTRTLHPPGGATALIAVVGSEQVHRLGFLYCLAPAGLGALILLAVGLVVNNIAGNRRYPEFWR